MVERDTRALPLGRRGWVVLLWVWLPLVVGYPVAIGLMVEHPGEGMVVGLLTVGVGAVLMGAVWWISGRLPWPDHADARFYLTHVGTGLVYSTTWWTAALALRAWRAGVPAADMLVEAYTGPYVGWNLFIGFVVYGLTAGVSYAVRSRETARHQEIRAAQSLALATRAQLTALQAQLNPHFLFNTLQSLTVLIRRDPQVAEDAVERLGDLLRYALDHGGRDEVLLRDEWEFVENYLALEKIRLEDRLCVVREVEEAALRHRVPPFCLQPLVENAIRHGLDPLPRGGTLWITVHRETGRLVLDVWDDGVGAERGGELVGVGLGLDAVKTRLAAWEDGPGSLVIETAPEAGFHARVTIPIEVYDVAEPLTREVVS